MKGKEDIKLVVTRIFGLESWEHSMFKNTFHIFGLSQVNHKERKRYLLQLIFQKRGNLSIATIVEEIKLVLAYKDDLECRDKSKIIAYFGILGPPRFWSKEKINDLIRKSMSKSFMFSVETEMEYTKFPVTEKWEFQYRDEAPWRSSFRKSDCQYSNARITIDNISIEKVSTIKTFLI